MAATQSKSGRRYGDPPKPHVKPSPGAERGRGSEVAENAQAAQAGLTENAANPPAAAAPAPAPEETMPAEAAAAPEQGGGQVEAVHHRHAMERAEMHHRHMHEHAEMHHRHHREHHEAAMEGQRGGEHVKAMHERHHKERQEMHTRHEGEYRGMHGRHEMELGAPGEKAAEGKAAASAGEKRGSLVGNGRA